MREVATEALAILQSAIQTTRTALQASACARVVGMEKFIAVSMAWRCSSHGEAIHLLLSVGHADEASILLRSLLADAQRLEYMRSHPSDRLSLSVHLWRARLRNIRDMMKAAKESRQPANEVDDRLRSMVDIAEATLDQIVHNRQLGKEKKFPAEGWTMARNLNRLDDVMDYVMTSHTAHGTLLGTGATFPSDPEGRHMVPIKTDDLELVIAISGRAQQYVFLSAVATLEILEASSVNEVAAQGTQMWREYEACQARASSTDRSTQQADATDGPSGRR
jgi:Family of unknown function (DUF5677)